MARKPKPIAEQLRGLIRQGEKQGITRYRLARLSGVSEGQLSRLMSKDTAPRLDTAEKIALALGHRFLLAREEPC